MTFSSHTTDPTIHRPVALAAGRWPQWLRWAAGWGLRWGGWRRPALRERIASLGTQERALVAMAEEVERKFVAIGGALQSQVEASGQLVEQGGRLVSAVTGGGQAGSMVDEVSDLVRRLLDLTEENNRRTGALLESMEGYNAQIGRLLTEEIRVERIVAPLRIIQTLFRIEAAVLPPDVQVAFIALSGEIPKFEEKVRGAFAQHAEVLTETRHRIAAVEQRLRENADAQVAELKTARVRIDDTLAALRSEHEHCIVKVSRLEELVRVIDRHANEMVVSLQFQDITRQKLEHVLVAVRGLVGGRQKLDLTHLHHTCRLEALQADAIKGDLERALGGLNTGMAAVLSAAEGIASECWPRANFTATMDANSRRVKLLREAVHSAAALLPQATAGVDAAVELLNSLGGVAATVAATASEMAEDMRMIALNAQVQAAQAGEAGAGLLILAERTYVISEEIKLVTRSIGSEFNEATRQLAEATERGVRLHQEESQQQTETATATAHVEQRLTAYQDETAQALEQIGGLLEKIEKGGRAISPELCDSGETAAPLTNLHKTLTGLAKSVAGFANVSDKDPQLIRMMAEAKARYTMDAERAVHHAAFSDGQPSLTAPAPNPTEPVLAAAGSAAAPDAAHNTNVELF